ncbi:hypothetical protein GCM10010168_16680 [Actinoplanes ianthinogenes]|uniref:Uncharacterized protein n=1 Tax=Actinoplanes ianthinogenes TaxID=122358 RepID=A0ABM7LZV3_9ACTN|nr:hypothetical protein [Actinoplanes ianthinogenes]BCJ44855.1 hypothetical protein Aiant_55120 [Actinoplanes ianthinogenes]GGR00393.1 hypothetical protein GCM10010168_16680 [Actinoplanes ianthinogenes]
MTFPPDDPWGTPAPAPPGPPPGPVGPRLVPPQVPAPAPDPGPAPAPRLPNDPTIYVGPVIVQIAEIEITSTVVRTPAGDVPLARTQWQVNDFWVTQRRTPTWAKIAGVAGVCFTGGLSLLLFLVKESVPQGTVQVTVTNGPWQYVARVPVHDERDVHTINQQVNYVRSLAAL